MSGRLPRALALAAALGAALGAAGCAQVPDSGPVRDERSVALAPQDNDARVIAVTASAGQRPLDVMRGFLRAADSFDSDHAAARSYLDVPAAWRPAGAVVYDDGPGYGLAVVRRSPTTVTVRLTARELGRLDPVGAWRSAPPAARLVEDYVLARRPAGWRLVAPPGGGLRVTPRDLARSYRAVTLEFPSAEGGRLVPELRYLPVDLPALPTALVRLLLAGPGPALAAAVRTAVPAGTQLVGSSPLVDGVLTVDLSREALGLARPEAELLAAQLVRSLRSALGAELRGVRLLADASPLHGLPALLPASTGEALEADRSGGGLLYLDPAGRALRGPREPVDGPLGQPHPSLDRLAVGPSGAVAAGLAGHVLLAGAPGALRPVAVLTRPLPPSVDVSGRVWTAETGGPRPRPVVWEDGRLRAPAGALLPSPLTALAVSPDGARLAVVAGGQAWVAAVGPGLRLGAFAPLTGQLRDVTSLAWADGTELALLARPAVVEPGAPVSAPPGPWVVSADGYRVQAVAVLRPVPATAIASGPGGTPLLVAVGGRVLRLTGGRWVVLGPGRAPTAG